MLRTTSGLSRPVLRWVSQVTASLGATLAATLIWSAVPHPTASPAPPPEMTSGGKFAARALDAVAYDGLETMPVPRVATTAAAFATVLSPVDIPQRIAWDGASSLPVAPERPARGARPPRAPVRIEARHAPAEASPRMPPVPPTAVATAPEPPAEESLLPRVVPKIMPVLAATARDAWAVTASAGESLVAHVVPQIP